MRADGGVHARARIGHGEHRVRTRDRAEVCLGEHLVEVHVGRLDGELAAFRHRIARVHGQVHDHLLELVGIRLHAPQIRRQHRHQRDVLADQPAQQLVHLGDDDVEVQHHGLEHLPAAVGQQLARQRGGALRRLADFLHVAALAVPRGQLAQEQLRIAQNRRQQIVEVVRDAPRELSHGLHLLGLAELLFEVPLIGDVPLRAPHPHQVPVLDEADDVIKEYAGPAVAVVLTCFRVGDAVPGADEAADLLAVGGVVDVVQVGEPCAHEVPGFLEPVHARHRVVALRDPRAGVYTIDLFFFRQFQRHRRFDLQA